MNQFEPEFRMKFKLYGGSRNLGNLARPYKTHQLPNNIYSDL